jgi:hypothetical protein
MIFYGCQLQGSFLFFHLGMFTMTMNAICGWNARQRARICLGRARLPRTPACLRPGRP